MCTCSDCARALSDLKDCLDFCSTSWVALFCHLGGPALLLQARAPASHTSHILLRIHLQGLKPCVRVALGNRVLCVLEFVFLREREGLA